MRRLFRTSPPWLCAFPITPSDANGRVNTAALRWTIDRLVASNVDAVCLLGSTGAGPYFSAEEQLRALGVTSAALSVQGAPRLLVGIGSLCTHQAIDSAKDALRHGAAAGLLAPVSYLPLREEEVAVQVKEVAAAVPELPLVLYNNPTTTRFSYSSALVAELCSIPSVVALKTGALPDAKETKALHEELKSVVVKDDFAVGYAVDAYIDEALIAGGDAWFSVAAGIFPKPCCEIVEAIREGRMEEARHLHKRLQPLWELFIELSSFRVVYAAVEILGVRGVVPPKPLLPLNAQQRKRVEAVLEQLQLK